MPAPPTSLRGENGRATLRSLIKRELESETRDTGPEMHRLEARLEEITAKIDSVIDLAAASPERRDLIRDRLGRLRDEKRGIESLVAGVLYEVQKRSLARESEVIPVTFRRRRTALVPMGAGAGGDGVPVGTGVGEPDTVRA